MPTTAPVPSAILADDVARLLAYIKVNDIDPNTPPPKPWNHMGAIIVDAALQRRQRYESTVKPRVENLIEVWPDANTTGGFLKRIAAGSLGNVIDWTGPERLLQIKQMASALLRLEIETPEDLAVALTNPLTRNNVRESLGAIKFVGPMTLDHIDKMVGLQATAHGVRLEAIAKEAGIKDTSYEYLREVITRAAIQQDWHISHLDYALWGAN